MTSLSAQPLGNFTPSEVSTFYSDRLSDLPQEGPEWRWVCKIHGGQGMNFTVKAETGCWYCHSHAVAAARSTTSNVAQQHGVLGAANEVHRIVAARHFVRWIANRK